MKIRWRWAAPAILPLAAVLLACQAGALAGPVSVKSSRHYLDPEDPTRREFGKLSYLSGIVLRSDNSGFGGFSGFQISADGARLLAVTDAGKWLRAVLVYDGDKLTGLEQVELSSLLDEDGQAVRGRNGVDAESLTLTEPGNLDGPAYVSFERRHRVLFYPAGLGAKAAIIDMPPDLALAPANKGIEAFERRADGALIALTEHVLDVHGQHSGWLIDGKQMHPLSLRREGECDPTDLEFLPDGDLLVLERRYTLAGGPGMQIRRIKAETISPGAVMDGEVLINLTSRYGIDNFEGLAVRKNTAEETILYIISDNNFSSLQKTLLLMFKLEP